MLYMELVFVAVVYLTAFLFSWLRKINKTYLYFISGIILWIFHVFLKIYFQKFYLNSIPDVRNNNVFNVFIDAITGQMITFLVVTLFLYLKETYISQFVEQERKKFQIESELSNLKAQISPHFLFNTMNNLYGLAEEKSNKLPALMVRLSELLRYSLYGTNTEKVNIHDELNYLKNYIELEKIRLEDDLDIQLNSSIPSDACFLIAPLLLITFIENAFKHSKSADVQPISISIDISINNSIFNMFVKIATPLKQIPWKQVQE
jgi:two-component system, LytTR family, sensor histidine kinase LytS